MRCAGAAAPLVPLAGVAAVAAAAAAPPAAGVLGPAPEPKPMDPRPPMNSPPAAARFFSCFWMWVRRLWIHALYHTVEI